MSNKVRITILIILIVLLAGGAGYYFWQRKVAVQNTQNNTITNTQSNTLPNNSNATFEPVNTTQTNVVSKPPQVKASSVQVEQAGVVQIAKVFIERYNSYSSDDNYNNVRDVQTLVTPDLWGKLSKRLTVPGAATTYVGVKSDASSASLIDWKDNTSATVNVQIIKATDKNNATTKTYQTAQVKMVKIDGNWLVDSFAWQTN